MATTMFGGFSSSDRRKKVVYGKSSRPSALPLPAPEAGEEAPPSPERPRKQTALGDTGGALKIGHMLGNARPKTDSGDVFDIPSEDEFYSRPKPAKKLVAKLRTPEASLNAPAAQNEASHGVKKLAKPTQPLRKPEAAKPSTVPTKPQKLAQVPKPPHSNPTVPRTQRAKTPQPSELPTQTAKSVGTAQATGGKTKATSQRNISALSAVSKTQDNAKTSSALPTKKLSAKLATKPTQDLGVFDVPASDDEAPLTVKKMSRPAQAEKKKEPAKIPSALGMGHKESPTSDDSSASNKRKRKGSVSSATGVKPALQLKSGSSAPQRSRKSQKKESDDSPGYAPQVQPDASTARAAQPTVLTGSKPKRTRQRTVPVLGPPKAMKGQSSPAVLNSMLPNRQLTKPSPTAEGPKFSELEDQTMYDIPDALTTPVRAPKAAMPGSTTPRQKTLFGGLLGDSASSSTPMPAISSLQLTDTKPKSLIGSLSRCKSDITHSTQARKTRLIDTLKPAESSSDDEEEDSSGEEDDKTEVHHDNGRHAQRPVQTPTDVRPPADAPSEDMDVDRVNADSQTSQGTTGFGMRPRLTYAMSRSYLRESNAEDDLMMTMDLGDDFGPLSQSRDTVSVSEDDADPTSQAQAHHELKSRGRNYVFQQEAQTMIDDMGSTSSGSIRRSAMIELCTKMADETFCSQLLDSPLAREFFRNISKGGEIIFDFATAVVMVFMLRTNPSYTVLDQILETGILASLPKLIGNDSDIQRIAKDRKTNLSKMAKESVISFRDLIQQCSMWSPATVSKVTPQLVSIKAVELLVIGLRKAGNSEPLLDQKMISQLVEIAAASHERLSTDQGTPEDEAALLMVLSILESVSATRQKQATWSTAVLERIASFMPRFLQADAAASTMLAVKLCMNLSNNKPKACQSFSGKAFVQPLVQSIIERFEFLNAGPASEKRTETVESLILSLGATINLAEFSDQMRVNADDDKQSIERLVRIFLEGSERASQVCRQALFVWFVGTDWGAGQFGRRVTFGCSYWVPWCASGQRLPQRRGPKQGAHAATRAGVDGARGQHQGVCASARARGQEDGGV